MVTRQETRGISATVLAAMGAILLASSAGTAHANGGTILTSDMTPIGGMVLIRQQQIQLSREVLDIELVDMSSYHVNAEYTLSNPGPAREVLFGVPLIGGMEEERRALLESVDIELEGKRHACQMVEESAGDPRLELESEWFENPDSREFWWLLENYGPVDAGRLEVDEWCATALTVPTGTDLSLRLAYTGQLEYVDQTEPSYGFPDYSARMLYYPLYPAGTWKGPVERLSITIGLGPYRDHVIRTIPAQAAATETGLTWTFEDIDLSSMDGLLLLLDPRPHRYFTDICEYNGTVSSDTRRWAVMPLRASSSFGQDPFRSNHGTMEPRFIADGNPQSGWCTDDTADFGRGQWIDLRLGSDMWLDATAGDVYDVAFINGLVYQDGPTPQEHGRVTTLGMALCDHPDERIDIAIAHSRGGDSEEAIVIENNDVIRGFEQQLQARYTDPAAPTPCIRLTVVDAEPGPSSRRTCISEFAFVGEHY